MSEEDWHGTIAGYTNHRCRCPMCSEASRKYQREKYQRRRAEGSFRHRPSNDTPLGWLIERRGYTIQGVAEMLDRRVQTVGMWCTGASEPSLGAALELCRMLGIAPDKLLMLIEMGRDGKKAPKEVKK